MIFRGERKKKKEIPLKNKVLTVSFLFIKTIINKFIPMGFCDVFFPILCKKKKKNIKIIFLPFYWVGKRKKKFPRPLAKSSTVSGLLSPCGITETFLFFVFSKWIIHEKRYQFVKIFKFHKKKNFQPFD